MKDKLTEAMALCEKLEEILPELKDQAKRIPDEHEGKLRVTDHLYFAIHGCITVRMHLAAIDEQMLNES